MNRREFVKASAAGVALSALGRYPRLFAAERTRRIGLIGAGWYGKSALLRLLQVAPADVVCLCDVDKNMLAEAAETIGREPVAIQLRYLQTLTEIGTEQNTTIVFPLPVEMFGHLFGQGLQSILDQRTDAWGIKVTSVEVKTVDLPQEMVRAISKQAEAERERREPSPATTSR